MGKTCGMKDRGKTCKEIFGTNIWTEEGRGNGGMQEIA